ncbi:MAG: tRNA (adenosine(37)-N6)-threonylcarbamoyltransferase complex ATPase subunit type 1 TsaE [Acidimicrobiales bacterium]
MIVSRTSAAAETQELAAALAGLCTARDLILLVGDLGAGKTAFAQGFGKALGVTQAITSPTFTLANEYSGRLTLNHLDVYRIEQLDEVRDLGLSELLDGETVTLIEWGDSILPALPNDFLEVSLKFGELDDDRVIEIRCVGNRWSARSRAVASVLEPWSVSTC